MHLKLQTLPLLFLLFFSVLHAQITVPFSVIQGDYEIGTKQFFSANDTLKLYDIGKLGGGNRWDFSKVTFSTETESLVLDPAVTPYAASYPGANRVTLIRSRTPVPAADGGLDFSLKTIYAYSYLEANQVSSLGSVIESPENINIGTLFSKFAPPIKAYPKTITYGETISGNGASQIAITIAMQPITVDGSFAYNKVVDAFGTVILPNGEEMEALRIRDELTNFTILTPNGQTTFLYTFLLADGSSLGIEPDIEMTTQNKEGAVQGRFSWVSKEDNSTVISTLRTIPEAELLPLFPNPFREVGTLEYQIHERTKIAIEVRDLHGRRMAILESGLKNPGIHRTTINGSDLVPGVYTVVLSTASGQVAKRFIKQ